MVFGGLQKNSLIDYPGKISAVLFVSGCNFDCPYCHNPELVDSGLPCPQCYEEGAVCRFLDRRKGLLDGVVLSGGEPTLQKDLARLCEKIKKQGYAIKLDTNGSRPKVIQTLIDAGLLDYVAMDIKTDPFHYAPFICKHQDPYLILLSIRMIMESGLPYEFRTTCVKPIVDREHVGRIVKYIQGARLYALQKCRDCQVLHPEFFEQKGIGYTDEDMMHLKAAADPWVQRCVVR